MTGFAAVAVAGCDLQPAMEIAELEAPGHSLAISGDQSVAWVEEGQITRPFDPETGDVLGPGSAWFGTAWDAKDLAADWRKGHGDSVWILMHDGNRVELSPAGVVLETRGPIPMAQFPANQRVHFELETGADGAHFVTTTEWYSGKQGTFLYRQDPETMQWTRELLTDLPWADLSYDFVSREVGVLFRVDDGESMVRGYDERSLEVLYELRDGWSWKTNDFSVFGRYFAVTPDTRLYSPDGALLDEADGGTRLDFRVDDESNLFIWQTTWGAAEYFGESLQVVTSP